MENLDADMLQAELTRKGNAVYRARKSGVCSHGWMMDKPGNVYCLDCGKVFRSMDDARQEARSILDDYI